MTVYEAYRIIVDRLVQSHGKREAENISAIILSDVYSYNNVLSTHEFEESPELERILERLIEHEPVQYITGNANFYGLDFKLTPSVLIPRPETEELVHWILSDHLNSRQLIDLIDIGTGSGCIPITIKTKRKNWRVQGIDKSVDALNIAQINSQNLSADVSFYECDFLKSDDRASLGRYNIIVSNPPYISTDEFDHMSDGVLKYEPRMALVPEDNYETLIFYKEIASFAMDHLFPGGCAYLELNEFLADDIEHIFRSIGIFKDIEVRLDLQGKKRMLKAVKK